MAKLYKLTDAFGQTRNNTQWGENVTHTAAGPEDGNLCSSSWIHAYEHPILAVIMNPVHGNFQNPQMWEAEGEISKRDGQLKVGCRSLTTFKRLDLPVVTTKQLVHFAIICAKHVYTDPAFVLWANNWINNVDRTEAAAQAAERAAQAAERAAQAAERAAQAAERAAWAAQAAERAAQAAERAAWAARAAERAAQAAERAADIDLVSILEEAGIQ